MLTPFCENYAPSAAKVPRKHRRWEGRGSYKVDDGRNLLGRWTTGDWYALDKVWITLLKANEFVECRRCYGFNRTITEIDGKRVIQRLSSRVGQWGLSARAQLLSRASIGERKPTSQLVVNTGTTGQFNSIRPRSSDCSIVRQRIPPR